MIGSSIRWLALAATMALFACGGSAPAPVTAAPTKKADVAAVAASDGGTNEAAQYVYSYNPLGKRDPFRSPLNDLQGRPEGSTVCNEPLCQWDLDQLKLVAVVTGDANPIAMVEDPQTRGYIIRRGTRVGKQGGQVTQILRDAVTVTEYFTAPDGKRTPNAVPLRLKPDTQTTPATDLNNGKIYP